jgi:DNA gyrase subunit A
MNESENVGNERILPVFIEDEMRKSYLDYSMSMITARALPDVRDGLKPVHRRVLFGMEELGLQHNKPHKKSARVVGDVIGKYHPHGDVAVYDSLVRMAQDFSLRYPMVNGQGNFGSVDGDPPAAMRYTECRMTVFAEEMLADLDKDTVDFAPNYDDSLKEPTVLPSKLPFLLLNGTTGIAVGMATNMAPHNLGEIVNGLAMLIDNPDTTVEELMRAVPGPDFPTGGVVYGRNGIYEAYKTGKGRVIIRGKAEVAKLANDREEIIISEIPYMVNKSVLYKKICELARTKTIEGISFVREESDRRGMRIVIGIKKDSFGDVILNQLYKFTPLQTTFGIINLALVNMKPRLLSLKELMEHFLDHRHTVLVRKTEFDLKKAKERAHILEGLRIAVDNIDEIVKIIRESYDDAHSKLVQRFGLSDIQAKAILDMRLRQLQGLERDKIEQEYQELLAVIKDLSDILARRERRMQIIKDELLAAKERYGDKRRTVITDAASDIDIEDLIADEDMVVTMTHEGYIKRTAVSEYRAQGRGGKGVKGMASKENDFTTTLFVASAHTTILFFTNIGRCYSLKVYKIPEAGRNSKGRPIVNVLNLQPEEKIAAFVSVKEFDDAHYIIAATERGIVNRQPLANYESVYKDGKKAFRLNDGDSLIEVKLASDSDDVILGSKSGFAVRFPVSRARATGRNTGGVRGMRLRDGDAVVGMIIANDRDGILTVTDNGYGKRSAVSEYRKTNRGGRGQVSIKFRGRNGTCAISIKRVHGDEDLMLITQNGIIIRMNVDRIRELSRYSQGVRLINLDDDDKVIDIAICERDADADESSIPTQDPVETAPSEPEDAADALDEEDIDDVDDEGDDIVDDDGDNDGDDDDALTQPAQ